MSMSPARARQKVVDRSIRRPDPLVTLTEWAIPNSRVTQEKIRKLRDVNTRLGLMRDISVALAIVILAAGMCLLFSALTAVEVISEGADSQVIDFIAIMFRASLIAGFLAFCFLWYLGPIQALPFEWKRWDVSVFGWENLPKLAAERARFIQKHFPEAYIAVDFLGEDPYLVAIMDDCREYFFCQWG